MHLIATCVESWGVGCQVGARVEFTVDALQPVISDSFDSHLHTNMRIQWTGGIGLAYQHARCASPTPPVHCIRQVLHSGLNRKASGLYIARTRGTKT